MGGVQGSQLFGRYLETAKTQDIEGMTSKELKVFSTELLHNIAKVVNRQILQGNDAYKVSVARLLDRVIVKTQNPGKNRLKKLYHWVIGGDRRAARKEAQIIAAQIGLEGIANNFVKILESQLRQEEQLIQRAQFCKNQYDLLSSSTRADKNKTLELFLSQTTNEHTKQAITAIFNLEQKSE